MALKDTDYMYASSNIRANEGTTSYSEKLQRYLECKDINELFDLVVGAQENTSGASKKEQIEEVLNKRVEDAFGLVYAIVPEKNIYNFLLYEYDCLNLKTIIKCSLKDISTGGMLYKIGTADRNALEKSVKERRFGLLPKNMAKSAEIAFETYAKTKDPRDIDIIIDKACFADMLENAKESGYKMFVNLVKTKIDRVNIVTFARISRLKTGDKERLLSDSLIDGGEIPKETFKASFETFDGNFENLLTGTKYKEAVASLGNEISFINLEKALDDIYLSIVKDAKFIAFGAEIPCAYLINVLYEVKNIRIILAGLSSSLSKEEIRERVRFGYV